MDGSRIVSFTVGGTPAWPRQEEDILCAAVTAPFASPSAP